MAAPFRVLDLAGEGGILCGQILADLGADVVAIEPPAGNPARRVAPFADGGAESLFWWAYARGKRSAALDLESDGGRAALLRLAASADVLIESAAPGRMAGLGLGYAALAAVSPGLVYVSITPFGQDGLRAHWQATDLTIWAASGAMALGGDTDRAPVRTTVPQAFLHAGADAAVGALLALHERERSGLGQHVDVSAQQSSAQAALSFNLAAPNDSDPVTRIAGGLRAGPLPLQLTWPCNDGYVAITLLFGTPFAQNNRRLLQWLFDEGLCTADDRAHSWDSLMVDVLTGKTTLDGYRRYCAQIGELTARHSRSELAAEGLRRGIYLCPILDMRGLLEEPQFRAREYWQTIVSADGLAHRYPGPFAKATPAIGAARRAPLLGEHTAEVLAEPPRHRDPAAPASVVGVTRPLEGLKVLDMTWVFAGPLCTRLLSDFGATVVKVESSTHIDAARAGLGLRRTPGLENSVAFLTFNAGKNGITLDPNTPEGRQAVLDLAQWADVLVESYSPKAMRGWGLGYEELRAANPRLIVLSTCLMGQSGPLAMMAGYGNMAAAVSGFYDLTGWPDRSPAGPFLAYTDGVAPRYIAAALLRALYERRETGQGQYIDLSQAEAAMHFLAPALLDQEVNGHTWSRMGNADLQLAPHGAFPAAGEDQWLAIACQDDAAWPRLCAAAGLSDLARRMELTTAAGRREHAGPIETRLAAWTALRPAEESVALLQAAGVAAYTVQNSAEAWADPQLQARGHFAAVPHSIHGTVVVEAPRIRLSRTPGRVERAGPTIGEHNAFVLQSLLGYSDDAVATLAIAGALQ